MRVNLKTLSKTAVEYTAVTGIYFLFLDEELVYIGQSLNVHARVGHHYRDSRKTFNRWTFIPAKREDLDRHERRLIRRFKPRLNTTHVNPAKPRPVYAPVPKAPRRIELTREQQEAIMFKTPTEAERQAAANWIDDLMNGQREECEQTVKQCT